MQNSDLRIRITSLYWSQTTSMVLCMQNNVPSVRNTSVQGSQPSRVVFGCKTAPYGPEKQVSMDPRHDLLLCECKTALLASDWLVSMCPNPHLFVFLMQYSAFWTRISSLYGSQTSFVVLSTHNCELNTRIKRLYWIQPSPVALCMQNSDFRTRITSLWRSKTSPVVSSCKTAPSGPG